MAKIAVVHHSGYGHTKVMAESVVVGAKSVAGTEVELVGVDELPAPGKDRVYAGRWAVLNAADAIIMGSPVYMGSVSAKFKEFMEASSGLWYQQAWKDKLASGFVNSGSMSGDKFKAMMDIVTLAGQHSMVWVSQGLMPSSQKSGDPEGLNRIGSWLGTMSQSDQAGPDATPPAGDRKSAEHLGARVAQAAARWKRGAV